MSLKNFHLLFIALSIALALFCAWWTLVERGADTPAVAAGGVLAMVSAGALVWYERRFLRRAKEMKL
jgi:hypothetical protein